MSEHTKEPWHVGGDGTIIYDGEGWGVANATVFHGRHGGPDEAKANARRIVACVNACAGWDTYQLEAMGNGILKESLFRVMKQRDELLAALELVVKCCDEPRSRDNSEHDGTTALEAARSAIASVKGGA